ncbi:MAG TPA: hypothetical protein PKD91_01730 [Bacteroidia bacterium]|nr:hypothetical protein [Bacteroidia bacterium]
MGHRAQRHSGNFGFSQIGWRIAIIVPFFLMICSLSIAQQKLKTPIKLKIEDGDFDGVSVVVKNTTTGETTTVPGTAKFDLDLKINSDYVLSFSKPGYITKKIALNTSAPADRVSQGFYPFNFEVNLFKQYDGVNIVVFNQPVGKISFNRLIDDFDYDTDYTKQIQSALKAAEEEIKKKQIEERAQAEQLRKDEEKKKAEAAAQAKADAKLKAEADKKAAEEAKAEAAMAAKAKKAQEEEAKKQALAQMEEEKRKVALAKMEEEERAKAKAFEEEEARKTAQANIANDAPAAPKSGTAGEETKPSLPSGSGSDKPVVSLPSGSGEESPAFKPGKGSGTEDPLADKADPNKREDKGIVKATGQLGNDEKPPSNTPPPVKVAPKPIPAENYEVLPEVSVEEIVEANRTITRVTVRKNEKETIFSKVVYNWGGIYFFRQNMSISESLYASSTGLK